MAYPEICNTAGVVVLYNPINEAWFNIQSYLPGISHLYVVDNSDTKNLELIQRLSDTPKVEYLNNGGNAGLAYALNKAASLALKSGKEWLLTMDQDSQATEEMLDTLYSVSREMPHLDKVGIISPYHSDKYTLLPIQASEFTEVPTVMTSGNLLNLAAYRHAGLFEEKLFIDYIDIEYCLRLRANSYKVIQINNAILLHNLGNISQHVFFGKRIGTTNHTALRRYYITRNSLYVALKFRKLFPDYSNSIIEHFWKELGRVILFEQDKLLKIKYILKGFIHYKTGTFGKFRK